MGHLSTGQGADGVLVEEFDRHARSAAGRTGPARFRTPKLVLAWLGAGVTVGRRAGAYAWNAWPAIA